LLQKLGGMAVVTIDKIVRQSGLYREAVDAISKGRHDRCVFRRNSDSDPILAGQ
jgi:hypothetical protein